MSEKFLQKFPTSLETTKPVEHNVPGAKLTFNRNNVRFNSKIFLPDIVRNFVNLKRVIKRECKLLSRDVKEKENLP